MEFQSISFTFGAIFRENANCNGNFPIKCVNVFTPEKKVFILENLKLN